MEESVKYLHDLIFKYDKNNKDIELVTIKRTLICQMRTC